eukprot:12905718-Prorocentrum_lima.AAC.1
MNIPTILTADAICVEAHNILQHVAPDHGLITPNHGLPNKHKHHGTLRHKNTGKGISWHEPRNPLQDKPHPSPEGLGKEGRR